MNAAAVRRMERCLMPARPGLTRALVGLVETPGGLACDACGKMHADLADAERAHAAPPYRHKRHT